MFDSVMVVADDGRMRSNSEAESRKIHSIVHFDSVCLWMCVCGGVSTTTRENELNSFRFYESME